MHAATYRMTRSTQSFREPANQSSFHWRSLRAALAALALSGGIGSCARRFPLTASELRRVEHGDSIQALRVHTSARMVVSYEGRQVEGTYEVDREIREAAKRDRLRVRTSKKTAGLILSVDKLHGAQLLWVTFSQECLEPACAYGFVHTEQDRYRLAVVPSYPGMDTPLVYRGCTAKHRRMHKNKAQALSEANEVYLDKGSHGRATPIDLEIKKRINERRRTRTRRNQGID